MKGKYFKVSICIIIVLSIVLSSITLTAQAQLSNVDSPNIQRKGAWVDSLVFSVVPQNDVAVSQLQANQLDLYALEIVDPVLYQTVKNDPALAYSTSIGLDHEITYNPSVFNNGQFNPFSNPKIREATNWLIDRNKIIRDIYGGLAQSKVVPFTSGFPEYNRYLNAMLAAESKYSYDWNLANTIITSEMQNMGASLVNGKWSYNSQPVVLIFIIRIESLLRRDIGDYYALQLESIGFTVDRQYKTSQQASPIWNRSNPADGLWHLYTGAWAQAAVARNEGTDFASFYTNLGSGSPLWQAYVNTPTYMDVATRLFNIDYVNWAERRTLFEQAIPLALEASQRVWIVDEKAFVPRRNGLMVSSELAAGMPGSSTYPFTLKWLGQEGGSVRIAQSALLVDPWNPIAGSNWNYDSLPIRATSDYGVLSDPSTGLAWPQRIESAQVLARAGLPITHTLSWVDLSFAPSITVPADAWVDWDAASQHFITASEKYTATLPTATTKTTIVYPTDLFTSVTWHDGSPLSVADFVMNMIMTFDRAKPQSAIYDPASVPALDGFMSVVKGVKIVSTNPLIIETYSDYWDIEAETIASASTWWPQYGYGPGAWHTVGLGVRAEAAQKLAFSTNKAVSNSVEWANYISGPSLGILHTFLVSSTSDSYIPYAPTLGNYITAGESSARWNNLGTWYGTKNNFWVGTGPFYVTTADSVNQNLVLTRNALYVDPAGKWDWTVKSPSLAINYPDGASGSFFTITGSNFPPSSPIHISINNHEKGTVQSDTGGAFIVIISTQGANEGSYQVRANPAALTTFVLDNTKPVRGQEGSGTVFRIGKQIFLPVMLSIPVKLHIWADSTSAPIITSLAPAFKAAYGTELWVEEIANVRDQFLVDAPAGNGPDLIFLPNDQIPVLISDMLVAPVNLGAKTNAFAQPALDAFSSNGALYGLPVVTENLAFFYNKTLVPNPPTTWDAVFQIGKQLQTESKVTYCLGVSGATYDLYPFFTSFGGYVFGKDAQGNFNPQDVGLDNSGMISATQMLDTQIKNGCLSQSTDWNQAHTLFEQGNVPFIMAGPWALARFKASTVPYGITDFPDGGVPFVGVQGFLINAKSKNSALAQKFLTEFMPTDSAMTVFSTGKSSAFKTVLANSDPDLAAFGHAGAQGELMPSIPEMSYVWVSWNDGVRLVFQQKQSPAAAMHDAANKIRDLIANPLTGMVNVPGSYQAQAGCTGDWNPACSVTAMHKNVSGTAWESGPFTLVAGNYEVKVALDGGWATNYGANGTAGGDNIKFSLAADGPVSFSWDPVSHVLTVIK